MIFDDEISDPTAKAKYFRDRSDLARLVHDSNNLLIGVFQLLKNRPVRPNDDLAAPILLTRHVMEMIDGVGVLAEKGCAEPCKNLLRSALEALLGVVYITKADSARRSIAYQLVHAHKQIKLYLKYDKTTPQGVAFDKAMTGDPFWHLTIPQWDFPKLIQNLEHLLKRPEFAPVEAEWQALKKKHPKRKDDPHWYSLFDGPGNVRELAAAMDMRGYYEMFYRYWSEGIHAGSAMMQAKPIKIAGVDKTIILPLRNPKELQSCATIAISFCLMAANSMLEKYAPDQAAEFGARYVNDIQSRYTALANEGPLYGLPW